LSLLKLHAQHKPAAEAREIVGDFGLVAFRSDSKLNSLADAF
jgi:hypothetical protein